MILLYIFLGFLAIVLFLQWDKYENRYRFHDWIDSVKNTCILKPFHFLAPRLLSLPRKTWKCLKPLLRFIFQNKAIEKALGDAQRPVILFITTIASVGILFSNFYKNVLEDFPQFPAMLISAFPLFLIWMWKNYDTKKGLEYAKRDLNRKELDGNWKNFLKFQNIILKTKHDEKKATAIYALGTYYGKNGEFPKQVHVFFKNHLENYWLKPKDPQPLYIQAIYDVLEKNKKLIEKKGLSLDSFKFPQLERQ